MEKKKKKTEDGEIKKDLGRSEAVGTSVRSDDARSVSRAQKDRKVYTVSSAQRTRQENEARRRRAAQRVDPETSTRAQGRDRAETVSPREAGRQKSSRDISTSFSRRRAQEISDASKNREIVRSFEADPDSVDYFQYQMARDELEAAASGARSRSKAAPADTNPLGDSRRQQRDQAKANAEAESEAERRRAGYQATVDRYEAGSTDVTREEYEIARDMLADLADPEEHVPLGQRAADVLRAGAYDTAAGYAGAAASAAEKLAQNYEANVWPTEREAAGGEYRDALEERQQYIDLSRQRGEEPDPAVLAYYDSQLYGLDPRRLDESMEESRERRGELYDLSADLMRQGADWREEAKRGVGSVGSLLVDAGTAGVEMVGDAVIAAATLGNAMAPMVVRSFGSGASAAAQAGGDINEQLYQGAKSAAIEWATEHLFGGNPVYDKGAGAAEAALKRLMGESGFNRMISGTAARVAKLPASMLEEGLEEAIGDYLDPAADWAANKLGADREVSLPDIREVGRDFAVGGILGGLGTGGQIVGGAGSVARNAAQDSVMAVSDPALSEPVQAAVEAAREKQGRDTPESADDVKQGAEAATETEDGASELVDMLDEWEDEDWDDGWIPGDWEDEQTTPEERGWVLADIPDAEPAEARAEAAAPEIGTAEAAELLARRRQALEERAAEFNSRRAAMEQRGQMGETVGQAEYDALTEEGRQLADEARRLIAEELAQERVAGGETSPNRGEPENHIELRDWKELGDTRIKAFSFDHPELHEFYAGLAGEMARDAEMSLSNRTRGEQIKSPLLAEATRYFSRPEIVKACEALINDNGQENYALAKRLEIILDRALTYGYSTGRARTEPNQAYIEAKNRIQGARNEWQRFKDENDLSVALGEVTDEQVREEFVRDHPDLAWQADGWTDAQETRRGPAGIVEANTEPARNSAARAEGARPGPGNTAAENPFELPPRFAAETRRETQGRREETDAPGTESRREARPAMPEPAMPMEADGSRQANRRQGMDWANRVTWDTGNPDAVNAGPGTRQSKTYGTVMDSETLNDGMRSIMDTDSFRAVSRYIATTNQADVDSAIARIREDGYQRSMDEFIRDAENGNTGSEMAARGALLMKTANDLGRMRDFTDIYIAYKTMQTKAAQTVQAGKIIQKINNMVDGYAMNLTPADQMYLMQRTVEAYNARIPTMRHLSSRDRNTRIEIDEGLAEQFMAAETEEQRAEIKRAILEDLGRQAPASWVEKVNGWRYFAMLFNPRTHMKNILGNALSEPIVAAKDLVNLGLQQFLPRDQRTTAAVNRYGADRANYLFALDFYNRNIRDEADGAKWEEGGRNEIDRHKTIFKRAAALQKMMNFGSRALDVEDVWFSRRAFARQMAREMKLNGISGADVEHGAVDAAKFQQIVDRATEYALEQTFRESSDLAQFLNRVSSIKGGRSADVWNAFVNINLPFKRTPANILTRAWQYSPAGLVQGVGQLFTGVKNGRITPEAALERIAEGITGTGLLAVGYFLAKAGLMTGGRDDDDKQAGFDSLRGKQAYSFAFGDRYISAENLGIGALPMLIGAELYRLQGSEDENASDLENFLQALGNLSTPVFETTMLSSVTNLLDDLSYSDDNWAATFAKSTAANLANQFLPSVAGAAERTAEGRRYSTFTDRTGGGGDLTFFGRDVDMTGSILSRKTDAQYNVGAMLNRVPGVEYNQIPYIDAWGREQDTGEWYERLVNNFVNPANMSEDRSAGVEDELQRLYDAGYHDVFPVRAKQSVEVNHHKLTGDEYVTYQTTYGQEALRGVRAAMEDPGWEKMTDEEKSDRIEAVYKLATEAAKSAVDPDYESSSAMYRNADALKQVYGMNDAEYADAYARYGGDFLKNGTTQSMVKAGATLEQWNALNSSIKALEPAGGGGVKDWQKLVSVSNSDMPREAKDAYYRAVITSDSTWDEWQAAKRKGQTMEQWCEDHYASYKAGGSYVVGGK